MKMKDPSKDGTGGAAPADQMNADRPDEQDRIGYDEAQDMLGDWPVIAIPKS